MAHIMLQHVKFEFVLVMFQEIDLFVTSLNQLKLAQTKFVESQESLTKYSPESKDKDILVPLTSSVSLTSSYHPFHQLSDDL